MQNKSNEDGTSKSKETLRREPMPKKQKNFKTKLLSRMLSKIS